MISPITILFIGLMVLIYVMSPKEHRRSNAIPTVLTTVGILGTFVGITIGLIRFDVDNVQASVPELLNGLRIAFYTSIFGIAAAVTVRLKNMYRMRQKNISSATIDPIARVIEVLENIHDEQAETRSAITNQISALRSSLVGDVESSVVTQIQKMRIAAADKADAQLAMSSNIDKRLVRVSDVLTKMETQAQDSTGIFGDKLSAIASGIADNTQETRRQSTAIDEIGNVAESLLGSLDAFSEEEITRHDDLSARIEKIDGEVTATATNSREIAAAAKGSESALEGLRDSHNGFVARYDESQKLLRDRLDEFSRELAENNTKAFIAALERAIRDFNDQLTEQFGENFKNLNTAVGRLLEWQEQYRKQMEDLAGRFDASAQSLHTASSDIRHIASEIGAAVELMDELDTFVESTKAHVAQLNANLESHGDLADRAKEAYPVIEKTISSLTQTFEDQIETMKASSERQGNELRSIAAEQATLIQESVHSFSEIASRSFKNLDERVDQHVRRSTEVLGAQFQQLDKNLEEELSKALMSLGAQLASLSEKFVKDYTPLTERLQMVVRLADGDNDIAR